MKTYKEFVTEDGKRMATMHFDKARMHGEKASGNRTLKQKKLANAHDKASKAHSEAAKEYLSGGKNTQKLMFHANKMSEKADAVYQSLMPAKRG
jgi:hypothetical protein